MASSFFLDFPCNTLHRMFFGLKLGIETKEYERCWDQAKGHMRFTDAISYEPINI